MSWKKGDVLALVSSRYGTVYRGCHVFEASGDIPYRYPEELRLATKADIDRQINLSLREIRRVTERETSEIERLMELKTKLAQQPVE